MKHVDVPVFIPAAPQHLWVRERRWVCREPTARVPRRVDGCPHSGRHGDHGRDAAPGGRGVGETVVRRGALPPMVAGRCFAGAFGAGNICPAGAIHPAGWERRRSTAAVRPATLQRRRDPQTVGNRSGKELNLFSSKPVFSLACNVPVMVRLIPDHGGEGGCQKKNKKYPGCQDKKKKKGLF